MKTEPFLLSSPPMRLLSGTEQIAWPSLPNVKTAKLLSLLYQLEQSQWWSPEVLRQQQFMQLQLLLLHAYQTVPFYRQRLEQLGFDPYSPLTYERWLTLPILARDQIQSAGNMLLSRQLPKSHGRISSKQTSGSTGQPLKVYGTELNGLYWQAFTLREHFWHRRDCRGKLSVIRFGSPDSGIGNGPDGKMLSSWGAPISSLYSTGPAATLNIRTDIQVQAQWLQQQNPDYLLTYPSSLKALLDYCQAKEIKLPNLKQVQTISETVSPDLRAYCQKILGAKLVDLYSSQEIGNIAMQCPEHNHYHIQSESALVEILDEAGRPCKPGDAGRVVVTGLHNFAMPLLRYEIRDYAVVGEPCSCGRGLPVLKHILGRKRNMVKLPNGEQRWPTGFLRCAEIAPIRQFQFVQTRIDRIEGKLVTERPLTLEEEAALKSTLHEAFGYPFELVFERVESIPLKPNGKFEEFSCAISS